MAQSSEDSTSILYIVTINYFANTEQNFLRLRRFWQIFRLRRFKMDETKQSLWSGQFFFASGAYRSDYANQNSFKKLLRKSLP